MSTGCVAVRPVSAWHDCVRPLAAFPIRGMAFWTHKSWAYLHIYVVSILTLPTTGMWPKPSANHSRPSAGWGRRGPRSLGFN